MTGYYPPRWLITTPDLADDPDVWPHFPGQSFKVLKTPSFSTDVQTPSSGRQVRTSWWSAPIWKFQVAYELIRDRPSRDELKRMWGFFCNRHGMADNFLFFDPDDNLAPLQQFGVGDGVTATFQLTRLVGMGTPYAFQEPVFALNGSPVIEVGLTPTTGYTIGPWGQITFSSPPGVGLSLQWAGSFMFVCHFTQDELDTQQIFSDLWSSQGINFESVKP